jgi:hypothetical protein
MSKWKWPQWLGGKRVPVTLSHSQIRIPGQMIDKDDDPPQAAPPAHSPYSDAEIRSVDEDKLDRQPFARRVAERIVSAGNGPSTVFGLAGKWGSGKSSTVNLIRNVIEQEYGEETREGGAWSVISFTPWSCADLAALTDEFYFAIATAMPQTTDGDHARNLLAKATPFAAAVGKAAISTLVDKYVGEDAWKNIAKAGADSLADQAAKLASEQPSFMQRFTETAAAIEKAGRNVLVVIDDIDRLHQDELLGVMKAVRLLGRFNRVHYLLSYDESTVLDVLTGTDIAGDNRSRAKLYLEKIIQFPFVLPPIQVPYLENKLRAELSAVAERYSLPIKNSVKTWDAAVDRIITATPDLGRLTLRSVYRWCNQLDILLTLVGPQELDFADAALITYLRLWHNEVYLKLAEWQNDLLTEATGRRDNLNRDQWTDKVGAVLKKADDSTDVASVVDLIADVFPLVLLRGTFGRAGFAVSDREFFDRYFALGFPLGDVRDLDIRGELETLASTGTWGPGGYILGSLVDPRMRYLVAKKALRVIDVVQHATSTNSANAAHELTRILHASDLMGTPWGQVAYALLGHAVSTADDPATARALIDEFVAEFGLVTASGIFYRNLSPTFVDDDAMSTASEGIRDGVLSACIDDLTQQETDDPATPTLLQFLWYLDDPLWASLRAKADALLQAGTIGLADLGGRFVNVHRSLHSDGWTYEFHPEFENLVPRTAWVKYRVPRHEASDVDTTSPTRGSRAVYAAVILREEIEKMAKEDIK